MIKLRKINLRRTKSLILCGLLLGALGCQKLNASPPAEPTAEQDIKFLPREMIIQFEEETGALIEEFLKEDTNDMSIGVDWLDQLNHEFKVSRIEPLYPQKIDLEDIKRKFPERAKRAPANADAPNLNYTYIFHFTDEIDLDAVQKAYTAHPQVKYTQSNQIITLPKDK